MPCGGGGGASSATAITGAKQTRDRINAVAFMQRRSNVRNYFYRDFTKADGGEGATLRSVDPLFTAGLAVISAIALGDRIRLGHVGAVLGFAVPTIRRAVIHLTAGVDPHLAGTAARRLSHRRGGSRLRCGCGCCWRYRRSGRSGRDCGGGRAASRYISCVPVLNSLVTVTGSFFRGSRPVTAILTHSGRACGRAGRWLREAGRRNQYTGHNRNHSAAA